MTKNWFGQLPLLISQFLAHARNVIMYTIENCHCLSNSIPSGADSNNPLFIYSITLFILLSVKVSDRDHSNYVSTNRYNVSHMIWIWFLCNGNMCCLKRAEYIVSGNYCENGYYSCNRISGTFQKKSVHIINLSPKQVVTWCTLIINIIQWLRMQNVIRKLLEIFLQLWDGNLKQISL